MNRVQYLAVRRMCGGGYRWGTRTDGTYGRRWTVLERRRVDGAVIFDWLGVAVAWRGDWNVRWRVHRVGWPDRGNVLYPFRRTGRWWIRVGPYVAGDTAAWDRSMAP